MFSPEGPSLRELAVQALSSVERGYDLLAPKFDHTPFRTPDSVLDAVASALCRMGPFDAGLDLCCGTGAGAQVLTRVCRESVTGVDFSAGMLDVARERTRSGGRACPGYGVMRAPCRSPRLLRPRRELRCLRPLPATRTARSVRPGPRGAPAGGTFAFPIVAPPRPSSPAYWTLLGFDAAMRVRNALWRPPFVMYYRAFRLGDVRRELVGSRPSGGLHALPEFGVRRDGSPRVRMVVARRPVQALRTSALSGPS